MKIIKKCGKRARRVNKGREKRLSRIGSDGIKSSLQSVARSGAWSLHKGAQKTPQSEQTQHTGAWDHRHATGGNLGLSSLSSRRGIRELKMNGSQECHARGGRLARLHQKANFVTKWQMLFMETRQTKWKIANKQTNKQIIKPAICQGAVGNAKTHGSTKKHILDGPFRVSADGFNLILIPSRRTMHCH